MERGPLPKFAMLSLNRAWEKSQNILRVLFGKDCPVFLRIKQSQILLYTYIVGCQGVVQIGGLIPGYQSSWTGEMERKI